MIRVAAIALCLPVLFCTGCARTRTMPSHSSIAPRPPIGLHPPQAPGPLITNPSAMPDQMSIGRQFAASRDVPPAIPFLESLSGPQKPPPVGPVYPQYYYVRPEHTPTGYLEGHYGRIDNYTPGRHTSGGYVPGHYRGDGSYTRPEHTSTGYLPGHYRAEPLPFGRSMGVNTSPVATRPTGSFRPYGR